MHEYEHECWGYDCELSPNEAVSKSMTVWVGVSMSTSMSVNMSLIISPSDSVIVNMGVSINLNVSSSSDMIPCTYKYQFLDDFQGESEWQWVNKCEYDREYQNVY